MPHSWQKVKLGVYVDKEIDIQNIKGQKANKYHKDIHYKDHETYTWVVVHKQKNKTPPPKYSHKSQ